MHKCVTKIVLSFLSLNLSFNCEDVDFLPKLYHLDNRLKIQFFLFLDVEFVIVGLGEVN